MSRKQARPDRMSVVSRVGTSARSNSDGVEILHTIAQAAVEAVPPADAASICVQPQGSAAYVACTDGIGPQDLHTATVAGSQLSVDILRPESTSASITLYSKGGDDLEEYRHLAELLATQAAMAMNLVMTTETLEIALASRRVIGQAVGIVMARYHLDEDRAFEYLVRQSQDSNVKLRTVAQATVDQHNQECRPSLSEDGLVATRGGR